MRPSSPRILPVCYAALCLLLIYVFTYQKKKKKFVRSIVGSFSWQWNLFPWFCDRNYFLGSKYNTVVTSNCNNFNNACDCLHRVNFKFACFKLLKINFTRK